MESGIGNGGSESRRDRVAKAVDAWVKHLIDLTGRNQLLYYRTLKRGTLELTDARREAVEALLRGKAVRLTNLFPDTEDEPDGLDDALRRVRTVHRRAVAIFEEKGIETLFVALGMATWASTTSKATPAAPVLLCPLELSPRGAAERDYDLRLDGDWDVNATLLHLLATEHHVHVDSTALLELLSFDTVSGLRPDPLFDRITKEAESVPNFEVVPRIVVGTFAYTKLPMVRDLQENLDQLVAHDLVAAIAGDEAARDSLRELRQRDVDPALPDYTPPADEYLILDADASQNLAINAALLREPLIIQGPPGTGKSQTIANLIATFTARGKKVLFVAEKRAAIDAVTKRLRARNLDGLVLDLHGGVTSKKKLAAELSDALRRVGATPAPNVVDLHRSLTENRDPLVAHTKALHARREPWELSAFEVRARLLGFEGPDEPLIRFSPTQIFELDGAAAARVRADLGEWAHLTAGLGVQRSLWLGARVKTREQAREAHALATALAFEVIPSANRALDGVIADTGLSVPASVEAWQQVFDLLGSVARTADRVDAKIYEQNLEALLQALEPAGRAWPRRLPAQLFSRRYRAAKRLVRSLWTCPKRPRSRLIFDTLHAARRDLDLWQGYGGEGAPRLPEQLELAVREYEELRSKLIGLGNLIVSRDLMARAHQDVGGDVARLANEQSSLFKLPRIAELEHYLCDAHVGPLLEAGRAGAPAEDLLSGFERAWLAAIDAQVTATDPVLASFDPELHTTRAARYSEADVRHRDLASQRVQRAVAERAIGAREAKPQQDGIVRAQAKRKRGHMTLRALFEKAPDVLTALRPCWVMSPLVVAQTLPPRQVFDVVIFDEASQVLPADAVPALLRAPQAVVAGDSQQLPPTTFFDAVVEDDEDEPDEASLATGFESILDVLDALLRSYMLTWHYRSEDERLIAFSNHNVYDGGLITFPGSRGEDCVTFVAIQHDPGKRVDTRSNDDEVAEVVEMILDHARSRADESLGVIAMGQHHASRIEALLLERLAVESDAGLETFFDETNEERMFVKNLERVQGDERDAIILSIGYAKQPDGRLLYRFGPILVEGGYRRLNVAVTRGRRRVTLVSSFSHADMNPERSNRRGVQMLRSYIKYVASGGAELDVAGPGVGLNPFEIDVKRRLEAAGLTVLPQYGSSGFRIDFAIPHPERPGQMLLAVEADGASYHSSPTARDRDRLRQQVLERLGWRFHRIWSTAWFNDPDREVAKVVAAYHGALTGGARAKPAVASRETRRSATGGATRPEPKPYVGRGSTIQDFPHRRLVELARWVESDGLLRTEEEVLAEMMHELPFRRRGSRIVAALTRAIREARRL